MASNCCKSQKLHTNLIFRCAATYKLYLSALFFRKKHVFNTIFMSQFTADQALKILDQRNRRQNVQNFYIHDIQTPLKIRTYLKSQLQY
jgi:hypothetical protein